MEHGTEVIELLRPGRFPMALAVGALVLVVGLGIMLTVAQMRFGLSSRAAGAIAVPVFLGAIATMVFLAVGPQGDVTITAHDLVVKPRARAPVKLPLPPRHAELAIYTPRDRALIPRIYGPMLRIGSGGEQVSFAAAMPSILETLDAAGEWPKDPLPPSYLVSPESLVRLARAVGLEHHLAGLRGP